MHQLAWPLSHAFEELWQDCSHDLESGVEMLQNSKDRVEPVNVFEGLLESSLRAKGQALDRMATQIGLEQKIRTRYVLLQIINCHDGKR